MKTVYVTEFTYRCPYCGRLHIFCGGSGKVRCLQCERIFKVAYNRFW